MATKRIHADLTVAPNSKLTGVTLREVLHAHIPVLTATSTVREAVDKMDIYQFPALVVIDEMHYPIAVLTEGDICRAIQLRDNWIGMSNDEVLSYATKDPTIVPAEMEISDALHKMLASGLTILPVVDEGRLSGVVLRVDLMQAILMDASKLT
ncbi:MAG: CBS domain-containing protein [Fimbriimonadaceae bacterium]